MSVARYKSIKLYARLEATQPTKKIEEATKAIIKEVAISKNRDNTIGEPTLLWFRKLKKI